MRFAITVAALFAVFHSSEASAEGRNPLIEEGIKQYNDLEYESSISTLSAALIRPGNTNEEKIAIYQYLGLNYLVLGREEEARGAFRSLLAINEDWSFDPVTTPPKILEFFEKTKQEWIAEGKPGAGEIPVAKKLVAIFHKIPDRAVKGEDANLKIEIENPKKLHVKVVVAYKVAGTDKFGEAVASMKGYSSEDKERIVFIASIPAENVLPPAVDYFITVLGAEGNLLNNKGDENVPLRVPVPEEARKRRGWLWGVIGGGAGAVALALAVALPLTIGKEKKPPVQNATVTIEICEKDTPGC